MGRQTFEASLVGRFFRFFGLKTKTRRERLSP
jgi:hypothetical protein